MSEIIRIDDMMERVIDLHEGNYLKDQPVTKIVIEDSYLVMKKINGGEYDIALERINDYKKIVGWITHLNEKNWFTREVLFMFLTVLDAHFNGMISDARCV